MLNEEMRLPSLMRQIPGHVLLAGGLLVVAFCGACTTASPELATPEQLAAFEAAGPIELETDLEQIRYSPGAEGDYRVGVGDVIAVEMPLPFALADGSRQPSQPDRQVARVRSDGMVNLRLVGQVEAEGRTLAEIEDAVVEAYHPRFLVNRPTAVASIVEPQESPVTVLGAVEEPGIHTLRNDRMTLTAALMTAGGVDPDGAKVIRIHRGEDGEDAVEPFALPVKSQNIPFADVDLESGDTVEVEPLDPEVFTVVGLVEKPGAHPYPAHAQYNLMQAIAIAGGLDQRADPRYVSVYRHDEDGELVKVSFHVTGTDKTDAAAVAIKPGDVVAVEQTLGTRTRLLISDVLRFGVGFSINPLR